MRYRTGFPAAGDTRHKYELSQCESSQCESSQCESSQCESSHWEGVQSTRRWFTAAFSVHDDKPLESLNKIFFGQKHREPRHSEANRAAEYLHMCRPEPKVTKDKSNRKKCYLEILGAIFRTEKAAVNHPRVLCTPSQCDDSHCDDSHWDDSHCDNSYLCLVSPAAGKPVLYLTRPDLSLPHLR